jgi:hypothetical protein
MTKIAQQIECAIDQDSGLIKDFDIVQDMVQSSFLKRLKLDFILRINISSYFFYVSQ